MSGCSSRLTALTDKNWRIPFKYMKREFKEIYILCSRDIMRQTLGHQVAESIVAGKEAERKKKEEALASLYEEYYDKIARYIFVRLGNQAEAEDLSSEVFLKALRSLDSYKEQGIAMRAWLFKIAHNLVIDHFRKAAKHKMVPIDTVQIAAEEDPLQTAETNIEIEEVTRAMEQLTREQREVLELRFFGGLTSKETGGILKKSDGAVREMQHAAIEKLRKLLVTEHQV